MKTQQAYVNPAMLLWGRESAGYSVDDIVEKMKLKTVTAETVQGWESGEKHLSYAQLKKLSNLYKRPVAIFYAPKPPWDEKINSEFRSLPSQYLKKTPPSIRFAIRNARIRQLDLAELHNIVLPSQMLTGLETMQIKGRHVSQIASDVRRQLKISFSEQKRWKDGNKALKEWREKVENLGLWVFKDPFKDGDGYDGFYLPDQQFPVIYLNSSKSPKRQIFTLFHELGHFLLREGGICFRHDLERNLKGAFQEKEAFCNAFAGEFLVSDEELNLTRMLTDDEIERYADAYKVSREVILRKCKDKGFIDWDEYAAKVADWNEHAVKIALWKKIQQKSKKSGGPSYYVKQKSYLGDKFLKLAFSQYHRQRISESQLANYLGVSEKSLPRLEATIYKK